MKPGDMIQPVEAVLTGKRIQIASNSDLLKIISVEHLPVLLVEHYDTKHTFAIHVEKVTTELHPRNARRLKTDK